MLLAPTAAGQTASVSVHTVRVAGWFQIKEPITLCKNSPHNSKAYSEFSVIENKRFEGFCSRLQESKQKGEDKRWWIDTA